MVKTSPGRPIDVNKDRDILAAGRALLFEHGPQAVTMEAVARTAGVAKPTLYRRYANRDELLAAVAMNESESMAGRFSMTPGNIDDLRQALVDFGCDLTRFLLSREHIRFIHALGASTGLPQESRESIFRHGPLATRDRLADWLGKAAGAGLLRCPHPAGSAEKFLGMLMGLDLVRTLYHVPMPRDVGALNAHVQTSVDDFLALHRRV
ncbi:MAG: TetR/AcrR family transcriptional regulator [Wenzhouxiangellaceae bacterium]|nr:TetR/AcrR family transcriptional regulator [Wenzhouxiangellaceae bacterium]MBS3746023.1 TetR/AcrR family transcriptional regulator [Wenzhouxiangellaceae bacterium]MBS3822385.1 TetR/AcrR family transcriptional regulator [Wenzhouxiangellaceae bacterium]